MYLLGTTWIRTPYSCFNITYTTPEERQDVIIGKTSAVPETGLYVTSCDFYLAFMANVMDPSKGFINLLKGLQNMNPSRVDLFIFL
jgi:hypothetical protein